MTRTHAISLHKHFWTSGWLTVTLDYKKRSSKNIFTNHALIFNLLESKSDCTVVRQVDLHLQAQGSFQSVPCSSGSYVAAEMGHKWAQHLTDPDTQRLEKAECLGASVQPLAELAPSLSVNEERRWGSDRYRWTITALLSDTVYIAPVRSTGIQKRCVLWGVV